MWKTSAMDRAPTPTSQEQCTPAATRTASVMDTACTSLRMEMFMKVINLYGSDESM